MSTDQCQTIHVATSFGTHWQQLNKGKRYKVREAGTVCGEREGYIDLNRERLDII
jgi:hypothetical protein